MVRRWILVLLLTSMSIIFISDEEGRTYIEKLRDKYAVDACDFSGWLSVEETSIYLPIFAPDREGWDTGEYIHSLEHVGWMELEFRDGNPYMTLTRGLDGVGKCIYGEGHEMALWTALGRVRKDDAVVIAECGNYFIADTKDRVVMISDAEYWVYRYDIKSLMQLSYAVDKAIEINNKNNSSGQTIIGGISAKDILYAGE